MNSMSVKAFADTNLLVYAFDTGEPDKQAIAKRLIADYGCRGALVISTQVLQEFFVVTTRKLSKPLSPELASEAIEQFACYSLVQVDVTLILDAIRRHRETRFSFWDCLILEAALSAKCDTLISEDLQHDQQIDGMKIVNPFRNERH